ncbi:serine/threonine-protein kinase Nek4 isoform X3 [Lepisosteus oculatus]|uniref:serine/threonine-protein kinase Nek4 isoform X3 n=1 Tax=Lepisosteus oculatus TaxID=7918 RepID=UPI00073FAFD4|nr:PREDICTED: serine/threonine-protein kinase Nek4 isoform X3 [Lepisosteus oculatus]
MENYSFIRVVGKGSYGEVTLVRHKVDGKQYVIKKLNLRNSSKRERKAAEQEAQLLSQLRHPNIVTYRESWEGEDCQLYIAMGFCEGGDLYHRLKEQKGRLLTERQVVEWFVQIAMALQSDVWALGCCVYEMATLKHAFNAKDMNSLVYRIVEGKLPPMPKEYNPQLGEIIRSMLNKRPEDRPEVKHILRQPYIKHQISVFLEATKEKTAKSRKKVSNCRPSNAASVASTHLNQDSLHQRPPEPNKRKVMKKESCSRLNKESTTASGIQPCPKPFPQQALGQDIFHSTGLSLATISGIDIDVKPSEERKNKKGELLTPDTCLKELSGGSGSEELKRLSNGSAAQDAQPQQVLKTANKTTVPVNHPDWTDDMTDKDNTLKLLQSISMKNNLPELKETLDTEKLLEPFVPVIIPELSHEGAPPPPGQGAPQLQPHSSTSEPSLSRQRRQRNREKAQESKDQFKAVPPRPLPSPPRSTDLSDVKKSQGNMENPKHGLCSHLCSSSDSAVAVSQDRPLSARERRRLKQSQEGISHSAVPASRRASCSTVTENKHPIGHSVAGSSSATDIVTKVEKPQSRLAQRHSDEDECSSSTSSTERLEGDGREGKSDSSEMQDLVQLMTQTLRMDSRDTGCVHEHPIPLREFKLNRKYRDTLILHGKAKEEQENFYFREFPTDSTSGPAKIKRVIECLRTDAVKGLGVKLLDKVLDIMEEDDEVKRELHLREQMGEDKYKQYAVMVRQLKFFEDVIFKE